MKGQERVGFAIRSYIGRSRTSSSMRLLMARWRMRAEGTSRLTNFTPIATGCVPLPRKTRRRTSASPVMGGWWGKERVKAKRLPLDTPSSPGAEMSDRASQSKKNRNFPVSRWVIGPMIKKSEARAMMIHDTISLIAHGPFQSHIPVDRGR